VSDARRLAEQVLALNPKAGTLGEGRCLQLQELAALVLRPSDRMSNADVQAGLDQLVALCNRLDAEARRRYGPRAFLFHEADSGFHIMCGDGGTPADRQRHIVMSSHGVCRLGTGAW
jgi:hypothetical protein